MKKRILSLTVALVLSLVLATPALATVRPEAIGTAYPATQTVKILNVRYDSELGTIVTTEKDVTFFCYALKDPDTGYLTNYAKLRDVAYALSGSIKGFNVTWNGSIVLESGAYLPNDSEMVQNFAGEQPYVRSDIAITMNGLQANVDAFRLTDYSGGGYTYIKLRDIGSLVGFDVSWEEDGIVIDTGTTYTDAT